MVTLNSSLEVHPWGLEIWGTDSSSAGVLTPLAFCRLPGHLPNLGHSGTLRRKGLESVMARTQSCKKSWTLG